MKLLQVTVNGSTDNEEPWFEEMNGRDKGECVSGTSLSVFVPSIISSDYFDHVDILVDSEVVAENTNEDMIYGDVFEGIRGLSSAVELCVPVLMLFQQK